MKKEKENKKPEEKKKTNIQMRTEKFPLAQLKIIGRSREN